MSEKLYVKYAFLVLITLVLNSCLTTGSTRSEIPVKAYAGTERPVSQLAVIQCGIGARVKAVDKNKEYSCDPIVGKLHVLPGQHTYDVWLESYTGSGTWRSQQGKPIRFKATAGHTYMIMAFRDNDGESNKHGWSVTVMDTDESAKGEGWIIHPNKAFIGKK